MTDIEQNKRNVRRFYELMFDEAEPHAAIRNYAGDDYIQHNPRP